MKNMAYRSQPQYRSWNASALGLKTVEPEEPDKIASRDRQRPRRESWSQPPQRGRSVRGRGIWTIDNRPNRPQIPHRRYTMPDQNYNYRTNNESNNQWEEDNPIAEEPSNSDYNDIKTKENDKDECDYQDEIPSCNNKYSAENIYHPPNLPYIKEHQKSNSSSDDGSQSQDSSKKYESDHQDHHKVQRNNSWERESIINEPDQAWTHDKYESFESDSDSKDKKIASLPVSPLNVNNEPLKKTNTDEITVSTCELSKKVDNPESPKDQAKQLIINSEYPNEITIKIIELINDETVTSQTPIQEDLKNEVINNGTVASEVTSEINSETSPKVTPEVPNPEVNPNPKVKLEVTPEVIPVEELPLINLDDDNNTGIQPIQPKISQDILSLDWESYHKGLIEEELRLSMERQAIQTSNPRKLDTELKDFDSLL
ncbi:hypothetical protein C1645_780449 [Glomus cerebriforme]|uniref:Uncharacterized protein n=1 Tax=Glomus cerebriforme TaxID=658196 RepID=A0A397SIW0_9GLOM|nr:hypothetical protein C1645_780449 [Glomus cerebriforme]